MKRSLPGLVAIVLLGACLGACGTAGKGSSSTSSIAKATTARTTATRTTFAALRNDPVKTTPSEAASLRRFKGDGDDDDTPAGRLPRSNPKYDKDRDFDNDSKQSKTFYDADDGIVGNFGHAAGAADRQTITALVERYNAAALAADGVGGCSLMYSLFAEAIPEDYGRDAGPTFSRGNTCAVVMTKQFKHYRYKLTRLITVTRVRVKGKQARAVIGSREKLASYFVFKSEHGLWKLSTLFAMPLP